MVLIEVDPRLQLCSACRKWADQKTMELIAKRKIMNTEHKKNRKKLKVGMLK